MSLYNGPGRPTKTAPANFEIQRKFMCRLCGYLAIEPQVCACGAIICRSCCKLQKKWNSQGQRQETLVPNPHLIPGAVFEKRVLCTGPVQMIFGEDAEEWRDCMVFKCVYGCDRTCLPYQLLENHVLNECPQRPLLCSNMCGNYKLADRINGQSTSAYICQTCFMDAYGMYQMQGERTFGSTFSNLHTRQFQKSVLKRHSVPQIFIEKMNKRGRELGHTWRGFLAD